MSLRLRLRTDSTIPVFVQGVIPEVTQRKSLSEIEKLPIRHGNQPLCLADLFVVSGDSDRQTIVWEGDHSAVHWIGAGMQSGEVIIEGNCGRHLGSQMQGGRIEVAGSVSDFVACENRGGTVSIAGDAGDWVGAAYPGTNPVPTAARSLFREMPEVPLGWRCVEVSLLSWAARQAGRMEYVGLARLWLTINGEQWLVAV